ncbi:MAG: tetratricopeptide repeat protein [Elusimicrobiales bacterium]|nr:tetratricopeptide repeat protein [Elusimicrobiales bacterium]
MFSKTAIYLYATAFVVVFIIVSKSFIACGNNIGVKAINACSNIITFTPFDSIKIFGLRKRAEKYEGINNPNEAYNDYADLIQLNEKMSVKRLKDNDVLAVCEKTASLAVTLKKWEKAFKYSNLAIEKGSKSAEIYRIRGEEYFRDSKYSEAIGDLKKCLSLGLDSSNILFNLGRSHMRKKEYKLAFQYLREVEKEMKNDFDFNMVTGYYYFKMEQYNKALKYYEAALRLNSSSSVCLENIKKTKRKILKKLDLQKSNVFY